MGSPGVGGSLSAASDVVFNSPVDGQVIQRSGGFWVNGAGGGGSVVPTSILQIDDFPGANDNAKHVAAWNAARSASRKPILQYPSRTFGPLTTPIAAFSGMRAIGPDANGSDGPKNQEIGGGNFVPHKVNVSCGTGTSSLFVQSGTIQEVIFANISFAGTSGSQWWHNVDGSTYSIYPGLFHSLSFDGFNTVLGNAAQKFTVTQVVFSGHWTVLNYQLTPLHIGGSDNSLWMSGYLNSNSPGAASGINGNGNPIIHFDYLEKSNIGYMFITAENDWLGMRVTGPIARAISIYGGTFEGRASTNPATRPVIDITGGHVMMYSPDIGYVTTANGAITQSAGVFECYSPHYRKASSAAATFPMLYQTGGIAHVTRPLSADGNAIRIRWKDAALGSQNEDIPYPTGNSRAAW